MEELPPSSGQSPEAEETKNIIDDTKTPGLRLPPGPRFSGLGRGFKPANINRAAERLANSLKPGGAALALLTTAKIWRGWHISRTRLFLSGAIALAAAVLLWQTLGLLFSPPKPITIYQQGRQLYNSGHYTQAVSLLREAGQTRPADRETKLLLVENLVALRQWPAISGYLNELITADPNDPQLYYWLGKAQLGAGQPFYAENSWRLVLAREDKAVQTVKPRTQLAFGAMRYRQGQYSEASDLLYSALAGLNTLDPVEQQQANYLYGLLLARDLRFDDALSLLQKAAKASLPGSQSDNAPLQMKVEQTGAQARAIVALIPGAAAEKTDNAKRARLAYAYLMADEYSAAEEQLLQVLRATPNYAEARAYLGLIYWRTGRIEAAQTTLETALSLAPGSRLTRQALAEYLIDRLPALQQAGVAEYKPAADRARLLLDSLTAEKADDATLQMLVARYFIARSDYQNAQQAYKQAVALNKQRPVAGLNPGAALSRYYSENNFDPCTRGVDAGLDATRDLPAEAESWYVAGLAYSRCGHPDLAIPMLEKARELRPFSVETLYRLGLAYDASRRPTEADRIFTLLADLDPERPYLRPAKG